MLKKADVFKQLRVLHQALLMGTFVFTFTVFFGQKFVIKDRIDEQLNKILPLVALVVAATLLLAGLTIYKKRVAEIQNSKAPVQTKMDQYRAACITLWACIEGPAILSAIGILLTGNYIFVGLSVLLIIIFFLFAPRKESIIAQLNLETDEVAQLESNTKS